MQNITASPKNKKIKRNKTRTISFRLNYGVKPKKSGYLGTGHLQ